MVSFVTFFSQEVFSFRGCMFTWLVPFNPESTLPRRVKRLPPSPIPFLHLELVTQCVGLSIIMNPPPIFSRYFISLALFKIRRKTSNTHHVDNTVLKKIKLASSSSNPAPFHSVAIVQCIDVSEV